MSARRVLPWVPGVALLVVALAMGNVVGSAAATPPSLASSSVPQYDHIFLIILENNGYNQLIGNGYAPILNALAHDYGIATNYRGVSGTSEPNYVAMLGGSTFGINNDNPYWFPGNTVHRANLMSQLEAAGETWRGYFQGMPYPGYRGYCYPDKCNGIPDADTQYVSKHNGIVNFADLHTPAEFAKLFPIAQLSGDLAAGTVPNFSYIVPDECDDMHGAPPWCVDSGNAETVQENWLIAQGDRYVGQLVNEITSSSVWSTGRDAIVITADNGNLPTSRLATIVITNHGPRGLADNTLYNHYSLLASLEQAFGLGCLLKSCNATPMGPLFAIIGSKGVPTLPPPFQFPTGRDQISPQGFGKAGPLVSLGGAKGWTIVPSVTFGSQDNVLAGISAASPTDAWAVGTYYPGAASPLATLAEHFNGTGWTAYPLPDVGVEENSLLGVSMPSPGHAWAVGYYLNGKFEQHTLIEHFDGSVWSVVPSPNPSVGHNILYGVAAISDTDVWAVGAEKDTHGVWQTLTEHWNGATWQVVPAVNPGPNGDQLYGVTALGPNSVYAVGQEAGPQFPSGALIEHWDGKDWDLLSSPSDPSATALPLGVTASTSSVTIVGQQETDTSPYTPYVVSGVPPTLSIQTTPVATPDEIDLFGATTSADGSTWAVGWAIYDAANATHIPLILHEQGGVWSLVPNPSFALGSDSGLASIAAIPGGGLWAVGETETSASNYSTLIEYYP